MTTQTCEIAVETDTALAAQHEELAKLRARQHTAYNSLHRAVRDRRDHRGEWSLTNQRARELAEKLGPGREHLRGIDEIERDIGLANERIAELDRVYADHGGWNRYFLVTNSNGHVHRGMSCSTCFATTEYAWLVELADCDEAAMVKEWGNMTCVVCFPQAKDNPDFYRPSRRDREAIAARQAEKDVRNEAKAAKRLATDERFRTVYMNDRVETVAGCKEVIRRAVDTAEELKVISTPEYAKTWPNSDPGSLARFISNVTSNLADQQQDAERAAQVLLRREATHEGWGCTQEQLDKMIASKAKSSAKAWVRP